ncbi:helix-turn-helix transcriptional regulator [Eubacteriales bacterium OttesenSCG-928-A19]|nr:helix-turn-helix transcriptional regulator [Eubacteriales bacterium OttesenSCG-928-A19]
MGTQENAHVWKTILLVCTGTFFALTAGLLSDFAVPWDETEIPYELVTIAGLALSALLMNRFRRVSYYFVVGGAALAVSASLYMEARGISLWPFMLIRLGLSPMLVYAFWIASTAVDTLGRYIPFTLGVLLSYATISAIQYTQLIPLHYGALSSFFCILGAAWLFVSRGFLQEHGLTAPAPSALPPKRSLWRGSKLPVILLLMILIINQLFNSLDVILFNQIAQCKDADGGNTILSLLIFLIGIGYLWGGIVAQEAGIPVLFIASCVITQVFLTIALIPDQIMMTGAMLPLYVIGSAGIDLSIIVSPRLIWKSRLSPAQAILGFVLFRCIKLYIVPSLFPDHWKAIPLERLIVVLMILLALGLMLAAVIFLLRYRGTGRGPAPVPEESDEPAETPPPSEPSLPENMTAREKEVLQLLLGGKDRNTIAAIMGISFSTVNKHCVSIYRKTGCSSHVELIIKYGISYSENEGARDGDPG